MASLRIGSARALRHPLPYAARPQARGLHMTGPSTFSPPLLTTERPAFNLPRDLAGLRVECRNRQLPVTGTKAELTERLNTNELLQTREFSVAVDRSGPRPRSTDGLQTSPLDNGTTREFNTSRSLKANKDRSTIDFAYLPDFDPDTDHSPVMRVPLLPQMFGAVDTTSYTAEAAEDTVMRPTIMTASADSTFISSPTALSEMHDNAAVEIHALAEKVAEVTRKMNPIDMEESSATMKGIWNGFLDDLLGPKQAKA